MLHSAPPPRAYLVPLAMGGFSFDNYYRGTTLIGGTDHHHHHHQPIFQSYADAVVDYADQLPPPAPSLSPQETNPYARLAWTNSSNCSSSSSTTPPPLDLSIKPTGNGDPWQPIEVDCRAEATTHQRHYTPAPEEDNDEEDEVVVDDDDDDDELNSQRSCSSAHSSYAQHQRQHASPIMGAISHQEAERLRVAQEMGVAGYSSTDLLLSPSSHQKQPQTTYHQLLQRTPPPHHHLQGTHALTPPSTPSPPQPQCSGKRSKSSSSLVASPGTTPVAAGKPARAKKKHARKLKFDEDKSSPVSGTVIIGEDEAALSGELEGECADIDPSLNIVNVSPEARAKLAKIENKLGPYQCMLCRQLHEDAFQLAQHRCSRIRNVDYRCPECDKRFTCPANLASHRRWHKPKPRGADEGALSCTRCEAKFAKPVALRKHVASHHPPADSAEPNNNSQVDKVVLPPSPSGNAAPTMEVA